MAGEGTYRLQGLAVPDTLHLLHELLEQVGREHADVGSGDLSMIETAVIEIAGNLIEHGRPHGMVLYSFELDVLPDRLEGRLADTGQALPEGPEEAAMPSGLEEDGRGLPLAKAALDDLRYERHHDANTWTMVRLRH